jgi:hypothetical protein
VEDRAFWRRVGKKVMPTKGCNVAVVDDDDDLINDTTFEKKR